VIPPRRRPSRCWTSCTDEGCSAMHRSRRSTPAHPRRAERVARAIVARSANHYRRGPSHKSAAREEPWQISTERQVIPCSTLDSDPKPDTRALSTRLLDVAPSRPESTLVQVRPLGAAEERPVESALGR
jgi:hypothetical protein